MTGKNALQLYRGPLTATAISSIVLVGTAVSILRSMPEVVALGSAGAAAVLAITATKIASAFIAPLFWHARATHIAATYDLRLGRASNGWRALRLYRHAVLAVRRRRHARPAHI